MAVLPRRGQERRRGWSAGREIRASREWSDAGPCTTPPATEWLHTGQPIGPFSATWPQSERAVTWWRTGSSGLGIYDAPDASALLAPATAQAHTPTAAIRYYHLDAIGSVRVVTDDQGRVLTDGTGQEVGRHDFEPFGEEVGGPSTTERRLFTSAERDFESGFDYLGARFYWPDLGRFTTGDPGGLLAENLYVYVMNDPLMFIDPTGMQYVGPGTGTPDDPFRTHNDDPAKLRREALFAEFWSWFLLQPPQHPLGIQDRPGGRGSAATSGLQQQPQDLQPSRLKECAKGYYGFNTLSGAAQDASRIALIPAAPIVPKAAVGLPRALGSGPLTNLLSYFSLGSGTAASGANILRVAGRIGAPIAIASAVIDATAIGICASDYQGWLPHF